MIDEWEESSTENKELDSLKYTILSESHSNTGNTDDNLNSIYSDHSSSYNNPYSSSSSSKNSTYNNTYENDIFGKRSNPDSDSKYNININSDFNSVDSKTYNDDTFNPDTNKSDSSFDSFLKIDLNDEDKRRMLEEIEDLKMKLKRYNKDYVDYLEKNKPISFSSPSNEIKSMHQNLTSKFSTVINANHIEKIVLLVIRVLEDYCDGETSYFGLKPDLTGLTDSINVPMNVQFNNSTKKIGIQTLGKINTQNPYMELAMSLSLPIILTLASNAQKNNKKKPKLISNIDKIHGIKLMEESRNQKDKSKDQDSD